MTRNLLLAAGLACATFPASYAKAEFTVTAETVAGSTYADRHTIKVTVTDENGKPVAGQWAFARLQGGGGWKVGPTGANGMATAKVRNAGIPNFDGSSVVPCETKGQDGGGNLNFEGNPGLSYTGGIMRTVSYNDGSSTVVNTAQESIIGASVRVLGMEFLGIDSDGIAHFDDGTLSIFADEQTVYLNALFTDVSLYPDPITNTSVLMGSLTDFTLNESLNSRYITELAANLAINPTPAFIVDTSGNLASLTSNFTMSGSVDVPLSTSVIGGTISAIPEPSSFLLMSIGAPLGLLGDASDPDATRFLPTERASHLRDVN